MCNCPCPTVICSYSFALRGPCHLHVHFFLFLTGRLFADWQDLTTVVGGSTPSRGSSRPSSALRSRPSSALSRPTSASTRPPLSGGARHVADANDTLVDLQHTGGSASGAVLSGRSKGPFSRPTSATTTYSNNGVVSVADTPAPEVGLGRSFAASSVMMEDQQEAHPSANVVESVSDELRRLISRMNSFTTDFEGADNSKLDVMASEAGGSIADRHGQAVGSPGQDVSPPRAASKMLRVDTMAAEIMSPTRDVEQR